MHNNTKDEMFYTRFHQQLLETSSWPGPYIFKFIVPAVDNAQKVLENLFTTDDVEITVKSSSKGKYVSISISGTFESPKIIIDKYKIASKIPNIIQL